MIKKLLDHLRYRSQQKWRSEIIASEPMTDHPVHPQILDEIVRRGGFDIGQDRSPVESEMEWVREACRRVSE